MKVIRFLLFPFAIIYDGVTRFRNFLFDINVFKSVSFDIPVIAVGNLSVGGTGKTPQIEYLIRLLQHQYKVAVLSRGYKRKTKGFQLLHDSHTAEEVGDEPLQFFSKFSKINVAVDANRVEGIRQLQQQVSPEVVLLDDAFQHRKVKAGLYILLTKYSDLYSDDFVIPTGNLRESRKGAKRADIVVVTKCPEHFSESEMEKIRRKLNLSENQTLYFSKITYNEQLKSTNEEQLQLNDLTNKDVVLVTGIANPSPLISYLKEKNIEFTHLKYPDHHHFTKQDIQAIKARQKAGGSNSIILTTEKDFVRLKGKVDNLWFIEIHTSFVRAEKSFATEILGFVEKF